MPRISITIDKQNPQPYRFGLDRKTVTIGRGSESDIAINCRSVSVKHSVMERTSRGFELRDLGSTNGTKVDGVRQSTVLLQHGSEVVLGDVKFCFELSEEEKLALAEAAPKESDLLASDLDEQESGRKKASTKKKSSPRPQPQVTIGSPLQSAAMFFCFLILAGLAFYIGLSLRHKNETGQNLLESIVNKDKKEEPKKEPVSSTPAGSVPTP